MSEELIIRQCAPTLAVKQEACSHGHIQTGKKSKMKSGCSHKELIR